MCLGLRKKADERIDHHIADEMNPRPRDSFVEQVPIAIIGWSEEEIRQAIGEHPVDFLWHSTVAGAESGLDMADRYGELRTDQRGSEGGVDVAIDQNEFGLVFDHDGLECGHDGGRLLSVSSGTNTEIYVWLGHFELAEKDLGHRGVVVLTGVHQGLANVGIRIQRAENGRGFHEVGTRAYDVKDVHWVRSDFSW